MKKEETGTESRFCGNCKNGSGCNICQTKKNIKICPACKAEYLAQYGECPSCSADKKERGYVRAFNKRGDLLCRRS
jgi:hypothetical protein